MCWRDASALGLWGQSAVRLACVRKILPHLQSFPLSLMGCRGTGRSISYMKFLISKLDYWWAVETQFEGNCQRHKTNQCYELYIMLPFHFKY